MTLSQFADIADLVAAFGVIASLLFLAIELRRSNHEARLANWRHLLDSFSNFKGLTNDLSFAEFLHRAQQDYHALTAPEKTSFGLYLEQGIHIIGNFSKHSGKVPAEFAGLEVAISNTMRDHINTPGARAWYEESKPRLRFLPSTYATIDALLATD